MTEEEKNHLEDKVYIIERYEKCSNCGVGHTVSFSTSMDRKDFDVLTTRVKELEERAHENMHMIVEDLEKRDVNDGTKVVACMMVAISILKRWSQKLDH